MDETLTISQLEDTYIEDLNMLGDWFLQYEYLLELSSELSTIPEEDRKEENKVHGYQSGVWLDLSVKNGRVSIKADSDALIIRGMPSVITALLNDRTPEEITAYKPRFIAETNLKKQISTDRFQGIHEVIKKYRSLLKHTGRTGMNIEERKKLVARLLFASQQTAMEEAEQIKKQPQPTRDFLYKHLRNYVLAKYLLPKDCQEDHIKELAVLSLARTMKLDKDVIRNLDQATPCDHATSESTKKVLLLYAVQTDLGLKPAAEKLAKVETLTELTDYVYDSLKNKN